MPTTAPMTLIAHGFDADLPLPELASEAIDTQAYFVGKANQVRLCTNLEEAALVSSVARELATHMREVDATEMALRKEPNAWLAKLREVKNQYLAPLEAEKKRLEALASDFAAAERRRVAEQERVRREEIARLENARLEAERVARMEAARVAQQNRLAEEAARAAEAQITNQRQLKAAMKAEEARKLEAARQAAEVAAAQYQAQLAAEAAQALIRSAPPAVSKISGMATRRVMAYEVTSVQKLYAARPELCRVEANAAAIRACCVPNVLKESDEIDDITYPGMKVWWEDSTSTRVNR